MTGSTLEGQLVDVQGRLIGRVRVSAEGGLWSGEIDLSGAAPGIVSLFMEFEELVNDQVLSLLDDMEARVARLGARLLVAGEEALPVDDLQIYPALQAVSFRRFAMRLYRPVGLQELLLIYRSGMRRFPPRLPEQPIFYPVLNEPYAQQISREWNATSPEGAGYVTVFDVDDAYAASFEVQQVGARMHQELWVPAEALDVFNNHIQGRIRVTAADFGSHFAGQVPTAFSLRGQDARTQLETLRGIHGYNGMDFHGEVTANHEAVFAHFPFWEQIASGTQVVEAIRKVWSGAFPETPLGVHPS